MQLVVIGTHQRLAPVGVRECLAFKSADLHEALISLQRYVHEGFILSTCNRVELYGLSDGDEAGERVLQRFLSEWHNVPQEHLAPHLYTFHGAAAVRHLFRLAAGLDSMVLGEDQIVGQLKAAFSTAQRVGTTGQLFNRLLHSALAAGKLVRTQTGIARSPLSVVSVAIDVARELLGQIAGRHVLVIGAGQVAELALKHLQDEHLAALSITNRTAGKAAELSMIYQAQTWPFEQLDQAICQADIVISCTAAPDIILDADCIARAIEPRTTPLLLLDLAVPRDIDRHASSLPGVLLRDIDDLQAICEVNRAARASEVAKAETLIEGATSKFMEWWANQEVVPTIRALRARAEEIRRTELERTLAKLPELSQREQEVIQALSAAIVNKLLHQPIVSLKDPSDGGQLAQAVQRLFQLSDEIRNSHAIKS